MEAAELLIYRGLCWLREPARFESARQHIQADSLSAEKIAKRLVALDSKREYCYEEGDIIHAYEAGSMYDETAGRWKEECSNEHAYMVRVPGMTFEEAKKYQVDDSEDDGKGNLVLRHRRRYQLEIPKLSSGIRMGLAEKRQGQISRAEFVGSLKDKRSGGPKPKGN